MEPHAETRMHPSRDRETEKSETRSLLGVYGACAVLLVSAIGVSLAVQGWNSRGMLFDHINFIDGADKLLSAGILPDRGDVSSYGAFATPGPAWLMVPGMLLFDDPRLYEVVGSTGLYFGTLLGLFLIARMCFGLRCAYLSTLLYGLSASGLFYAGSLWSIGHPFFYIWMVYFCFLWVRRNDSNYLAAALVTWSIGMYVDMVLAPIMFIFPAIWLICRPKMRIAPLVLAAGIVSLVWYPYLRFQANRNFVDLKSLVQRHHILPKHYQDSWCMPDLVLQDWDKPASSNAESTFATHISNQQPTPHTWYGHLTKKARERIAVLVQGLTYNFDRMTWSSAAAIPLLLLAMTTMAFIALQTLARSVAFVNSRAWLRWIPRLAWLTLFFALLFNEVFVARLLTADGSLVRSRILSVRILQAGLISISLVLLLRKKKISEFFDQFVVHESGESNPYSQCADNRTLFELSLVVPWLVLLAVAESGRLDRYWWLWPLQTVAIVAAVTYIPERIGWPRRAMWIVQISLTLILLTHSSITRPVKAWARSGWPGPRASDIETLDYLANQVHSEGRNRVAIGYQILTEEYNAAFNIVDPRYKVGAALDLFLKQRYKISNANQCAEGVSSVDEYRIVQTTPRRSESKPGRQYFDIPLDQSFRMLRQFGDYQVFKRIR
jgi:hypothetical protein